MFNWIANLFKKKNTEIFIEKYTTKEGSKYRKFLIPVGNKKSKQVEKNISKLIEEYKEDIEFDESSGEVKINGDIHIPYKKEYWIPEKSS